MPLRSLTLYRLPAAEAREELQLRYRSAYVISTERRQKAFQDEFLLLLRHLYFPMSRSVMYPS